MSSLSSVTYLFLSTTPLLLLFIYFIYLSLQRPQVIAEQYENNNDEDIPPLITLDSILYTFLSTLVLWSSLFIYLKIFVKKRRSLMQNYTSDEFTSRIVGDVYYEKPKGCAKLCNRLNHTDLAYVTYRHPEDGKYVQKKIRTYHAYHREKVAVVLLQDMPLSGLPLADVERDILSYQSEYAVRNRDRISQVAAVCFIWMTFCMFGAIVVLNQMAAVNDELPVGVEDVENMPAAWRAFWIFTCLVMPFISLGGNWIQWSLHKNWIVHGGSIVTNPSKIPPKSIEPNELNNDGDGGFSLL